MPEPLFTPHGGYRTLDSFRLASIIYFATVDFCRKHIKSGRQTEQMVQAGRSGRQNIAEGSERSSTSTNTEIQLTDVACASLVELQLDYEDFLYFSGKTPWADDDENSLAIKKMRLDRFELGDNEIRRFSEAIRTETAKFDRWLKSDDPVMVANALIRLCDRTCYLLRRQRQAQGDQFLEDGGFKERMTRQRYQVKDAATGCPVCPVCGASMRLRTVKKGARVGENFWGCTKYPACNGAVDVGKESRPEAT